MVLHYTYTWSIGPMWSRIKPGTYPLSPLDGNFYALLRTTTWIIWVDMNSKIIERAKSKKFGRKLHSKYFLSNDVVRYWTDTCILYICQHICINEYVSHMICLCIRLLNVCIHCLGNFDTNIHTRLVRSILTRTCNTCSTYKYTSNTSWIF
jgi:hypothetical protein